MLHYTFAKMAPKRGAARFSVMTVLNAADRLLKGEDDDYSDDQQNKVLKRPASASTRPASSSKVLKRPASDPTEEREEEEEEVEHTGARDRLKARKFFAMTDSLPDAIQAMSAHCHERRACSLS